MPDSGSEHQQQGVTKLDLLSKRKKTTDEPSDELLLHQFVNASEIAAKQAAFHALLSRYKQKIFEFIYFQVSQNAHDAEDLTQDVFVQLYQSASAFRGDAKFSSFLYSIARNLIFNFYRKRNRSTDYHSEIDVDSCETNKGAAMAVTCAVFFVNS